MGWLGDFVGEIAGALFPGARAIVTKAVDRAVDVVVKAGREMLQSWLSNQTSTDPPNTTASAKAHKNKAEDLAEEEAYLAEKFKRDKQRTAVDEDRIAEINAEREKLREEMGKTNAVKSAEDITNTEGLVST